MAPEGSRSGEAVALAKRRSFVISTSLVAIGMAPANTARAADQLNVRIRLDQAALDAIPAPMRSNLDIQKDVSPEAAAMIKAAPAEKAVPIILIVAGILAVPVLLLCCSELSRRCFAKPTTEAS